MTNQPALKAPNKQLPSGFCSSNSDLLVRTVIIEFWMCSISDYFLRLASWRHAFIICLQFNYLNVWDQTHFCCYFMQCSIHLWKKELFQSTLSLATENCFSEFINYLRVPVALRLRFVVLIFNEPCNLVLDFYLYVSSFWKFECIFICYSLWFYSTFVILMYFNFLDLISELLKK